MPVLASLRTRMRLQARCADDSLAKASLMPALPPTGTKLSVEPNGGSASPRAAAGWAQLLGAAHQLR
ncbi:MAG: hypothetical protein LBQ06_02030, partial [Frankiaceae bacterium]|nr:hypothetical protein [Frankiaceae bacterium]